MDDPDEAATLATHCVEDGKLDDTIMKTTSHMSEATKDKNTASSEDKKVVIKDNDLMYRVGGGKVKSTVLICTHWNNPLRASEPSIRRSFTQKKLTLPGNNSLPSSIPLIYPSNGTYDFTKNELSLDVEVPRSGFKVLPEALQLLRSITKPVAVVSVCGPCRSGKSYILSRMLGSADAFALGHTVNAKTFGIWIGTTVLECDEFTMLLLDTEGIDYVEAEAKDDAGILVLSVLLSSCFIYNSTGVPKKGDLNSMTQFEMITRSIIGKRAGENESTLSKHFPDFIWLLRDMVLNFETQDGQKLSPTEYLIQKVLNHGRGKVASTADKVAGAIMMSFPSITCVSLPSPSDNAEVVRNIALRQLDISPKFNEGVEGFVHYICDHAKPKCGYEIGSEVVGPLLAEMVIKYVEIVNKPGAIPCISDVWSATVDKECTKQMEELKNAYDVEVGEIISKRGMPMEEGDKQDEDTENPTTLLGIHGKIYRQKIATLIKRVGSFLSSKQIQDINSKFTDAFVGPILKKYKDANYQRSDSTCRRIFADLYRRIKEKTELTRLTAGTESEYTFEDLVHELNTLETEYYKQAMGPAKRKVYEEQNDIIEETKRTFKYQLEFQKEHAKLKDESKFGILIECAHFECLAFSQ
eukprot:Em0007g90a